MATCYPSISSSLTTPKPTSNPSNPLFVSTTISPLSISNPSSLSIKTKPFHQIHPHRPILPIPTSSPHKISIPHAKKRDQTTPSLPTICAKGVSALLFGSLILLGRFNVRPAVALPDAPKSSATVSSEEASDTRSGEEDEGEMYARILERNPKDVEALKVMLYGKMKKGKTAEAVEYVERLVELEPDEVEWRLLQALSYELMGQLGKAKSLFREILKKNPLLLRALHGLALAMHKNQEGRAVFDMLNKALKLAQRENRVTEERNIKILIAQMHVVKGDLEGASSLFQNLVNENPRDFRPYLCQGIIYSLLDRKEEADKQFEVYRSLVPSEFPQRGFIDDVILSAKTESQEQLQKEFDSEFSK